jgi:hypothetical protein
MVQKFQIQRIEKLHQGFPPTITIGVTPCTVICIRVASHDQVEIFILTITYEFLKFLCTRRILGIMADK